MGILSYRTEFYYSIAIFLLLVYSLLVTLLCLELNEENAKIAAQYLTDCVKPDVVEAWQPIFYIPKENN